MSAVTIYHNPRCSKSRETLSLIEEQGITPTIVKYLEDTPSEAALTTLVEQLGLEKAHDLVRTGEAEYKEAGLSAASDDATVMAAMAKFPRLIQRPIVVKGDQAVLGRPPENVLELLK
ncbi:MAG TPA: arsenate reductase (glutaredoxin) [Alcanivoracaceae bacterium]|nr:arsenate reductase (glutaredoxin) [Alcanivoracaceae bacterium]